MSFATHQNDGVFRRLLLSDREEYQHYKVLTKEDVPPLSENATIAKVTSFSIRYDDGLRSWYVDRADKAVIRSYREYRSEEDIEAGAFPISEFYTDGKGKL